MKFITLTATEGIPSAGKNLVVLGYDSWDDWFEYETTYNVFLFDAEGLRHRLGSIKIGETNQESRRANLPREFEVLPGTFFSVGQSEDYYKDLHQTGFSGEVLTALNDVAFNLELYEKFKSEKVARTSLFRTVDGERVQNKFHRLARGDVELTPFSFEYRFDLEDDDEGGALEFEVEPHSHPPTNIHAIIGRNGVGKTTCLNNIGKSYIEKHITDLDWSDPESASKLKVYSDFGGGSFANLISVTFSAFDPFFTETRSTKGRYSYIGLKQQLSKEDKKAAEGSGIEFRVKGPEDLTRDFINSGILCLSGSKRQRWKEALKNLASDTIFEESEIIELSEPFEDADDWKDEARRVFRRLSSGHKIVLLTITRLVELVQEKSLVLLDEPESHLHPPLLSAFVRTLSDLMIAQNGVAIIATHSPVVLQETPKNCSWILDRTGNTVRARRPNAETFGEGVGMLTHEVFGLEVTETGFYDLLREEAQKLKSYDKVIAKFGGKIGSEGRAVLHALLPSKKKNRVR